MKRSLLITFGALIILLVLGIWIYLMVFGTPKNSGEVFTNFGFDFTPRPTTVVPGEFNEEPEYTVDVTNDRLQQLTTDPVAGFVGTIIASSTVVRYVEQGTGHIYQIDLTTGEETMISRTTIPRVQSATFSADGTHVAITSAIGYTKDTYFAFINEEEGRLDGINLPPNAENILVVDGGTILYTYYKGGENIGYAQTIENSAEEQFRLPFRYVNMLWRRDGSYFYNKPARDLLGYLYRIDGRGYAGTPISGYGLIVDDFGEHLGFSQYSSGEVFSDYWRIESNEINPSSIVLIPEKCTSFYDKTAICAAPINNNLMIDDWYKGVAISEDQLWQVNIEGGQATLLENLSNSTGRIVDIENINVDAVGLNVLFSNKIDGTLWRYSL